MEKGLFCKKKSMNNMVDLPNNESGTLDIAVFDGDSDEETNHVIRAY